jgi:hypothetical protein
VVLERKKKERRGRAVRKQIINVDETMNSRRTHARSDIQMFD